MTTVRFFSLMAWMGILALALVAGLTACHRTDPADPAGEKQVNQAFAAFKEALGARHAPQVLDAFDQSSRDYLHAAATTAAPDPSAPDEEVRELVRQAAVRLTPGGVQSGFTLEVPLQRVLEAGSLNARDLPKLALGPVTMQAGQAHAEILWQGEPTTLQLTFVRESGLWKIDLIPLTGYAELALRVDRAVKGQTEAQQIARLVAQLPVS